jgi:hypothetical protein
MKPVTINRFESGTGLLNRFQKKTGLPALFIIICFINVNIYACIYKIFRFFTRIILKKMRIVLKFVRIIEIKIRVKVLQKNREKVLG